LLGQFIIQRVFVSVTPVDRHQLMVQLGGDGGRLNGWGRCWRGITPKNLCEFIKDAHKKAVSMFVH
jgi:hypothetical protein